MQSFTPLVEQENFIFQSAETPCIEYNKKYWSYLPDEQRIPREPAIWQQKPIRHCRDFRMYLENNGVEILHDNERRIEVSMGFNHPIVDESRSMQDVIRDDFQTDFRQQLMVQDHRKKIRVCPNIPTKEEIGRAHV